MHTTKFEGTRKRALAEDVLIDVTEQAEAFGIPLPVAMSSGLLELVEDRVDGECAEEAGEAALRMYKLHHSGKLLPFRTMPREDGEEFCFRMFVNVCLDPEEIAVKAVRGRGDWGEEVLTLCLPEEDFAFTGKLMRIRAEHLANLARFLGKDDVLSFVRVEPQGAGAVLLAMNGHALGMFHDPDTWCREPFCLWLTPGLLRECKPKAGDRGERYLILDEDRATVEDRSGKVLYIEPEDVVQKGLQYPEWRTMVERHVNAAGHELPAHRVLIAPESLPPFDLQGRRGLRGLRFFVSDPEGAVLVRHAGYPEFLGLVMPLKSKAYDGEEVGVMPARPDWMTPPPADFEALDAFLAPEAEAAAEDLPYQEEGAEELPEAA